MHILDGRYSRILMSFRHYQGGSWIIAHLLFIHTYWFADTSFWWIQDFRSVERNIFQWWFRGKNRLIVDLSTLLSFRDIQIWYISIIPRVCRVKLRMRRPERKGRRWRRRHLGGRWSKPGLVDMTPIAHCLKGRLVSHGCPTEMLAVRRVLYHEWYHSSIICSSS